MLKGRKEIFSEGLDAYMDYRRPESIQNWILGILGRSWREKRSKGEWLTSVSVGAGPAEMEVHRVLYLREVLVATMDIVKCKFGRSTGELNNENKKQLKL